MNIPKTECMAINCDSKVLPLERGVLRGVDVYRYLGVSFTEQSSSETKIKTSIAQGRVITGQLHGMLCIKRIKSNTK